MKTLRLAAVLVLAAATVGAGEFSLHLEALPWPAPDPRTEARRAVWNAPMGRLAYELNQQQAALRYPGLPGGASAIVFRLKLQEGIAPALVAASVSGGVELYEERMTVIRWPWESSEEKPPLALDEQLSLLLGRRLEVR